MKKSSVLTISLVLFLVFVLAQNYVLRPKAAPLQEQTTETPAQHSNEIVVRNSAPNIASISTSTPVTSANDTLDDDRNISALDPASEQAIAEKSLATLERIRAVPGAADLVDEIVEFLQNNPYGEFSMDNLGENEEGLVELNDETLSRMIRNDDVRAKWMKLMSLIAKNPDLVTAIQGSASN